MAIRITTPTGEVLSLREIISQLSVIGAFGISLGLLTFGACGELRREQELEQRANALNQRYKPIQERVEKIREDRRQNNWTTAQTFTNEDGSADIYRPLEDIAVNGNKWTVYYTDPKTKRVTAFEPSRGTSVFRDLGTNQQPYIEFLEERKGLALENPEEHYKYNARVHIR